MITWDILPVVWGLLFVCLFVFSCFFVVAVVVFWGGGGGFIVFEIWHNGEIEIIFALIERDDWAMCGQILYAYGTSHVMLLSACADLFVLSLSLTISQ